MEGVLIYNYYKDSDPDCFYKVWFRNPEASFYVDDRITWPSRTEDFCDVKEFTVGGPKLLIKW